MSEDIGREQPTLLERIGAALPSLTTGERRVAEAVLRDPDSVADTGIVELAQEAGTSTASVNRFLRKLTIAGYGRFRLEIARDLSSSKAADPDFDPSSTIEVDADVDTTLAVLAASSVHAIRRTAALLDRDGLDAAAEAIDGARQVHVYAFGGSAEIARYLAQELRVIGIVTTAEPDVTNAAAQAVSLSETDVAVGISHSGISRHVLDLIDIAGRRGATTIGISASVETPLAQAVDLPLITTQRSASSRYRGTAGRHAQLFVADALYVRVAQRRNDTVTDYLRLAGEETQRYLLG